MDDLVGWLGEQLDEDERIARAATPGPWHAQDGGVVSDDDEQWPVGAAESAREREDRVHIAAHDPARVLREIDAQRQLLVTHAPSKPKGRPTMEAHCQSCTTAQAWDDVANESNCLTLRLLALPYADRPGYRADWRP